ILNISCFVLGVGENCLCLFLHLGSHVGCCFQRTINKIWNKKKIVPKGLNYLNKRAFDKKINPYRINTVGKFNECKSSCFSSLRISIPFISGQW
ncbi:MAG: hypothetical protein KAG56_00610, partial [Sulfurovaceae bacterium]|nr:hypothetical protein [Sulfurovaceae bacterium]